MSNETTKQPETETPEKTLPVRIAEPLHRRCKVRAAETGVTLGALVTQAIEQHLSR